MSKDFLIIHTANFLALQKDLGRPISDVYFKICRHLWEGHGLPADDKQCAGIAKMTVRRWREIKSSIWPHLESHDREWILVDHETADLMMENAAAAEDEDLS